MDPTSIAAPFLAQGVWGAAVVALCVVIWRMWTEIRACHELQRGLLERVLVGMNTMGAVVADSNKAQEANTRALETVARNQEQILRAKP